MSLRRKDRFKGDKRIYFDSFLALKRDWETIGAFHDANWKRSIFDTINVLIYKVASKFNITPSQVKGKHIAGYLYESNWLEKRRQGKAMNDVRKLAIKNQ